MQRSLNCFYETVTLPRTVCFLKKLCGGLRKKSNKVCVWRDAGATWKLAANLKPNERGFIFSPNWFGCYAWDSINNYLYVSAMGNPVYRMKL